MRHSLAGRTKDPDEVVGTKITNDNEGGWELGKQVKEIHRT